MKAINCNAQVFVTCLILIASGTFLTSCMKDHIKPEDQITGETVVSEATLSERITLMKSTGKYSDTMAAASNGGGAVITGNSQMERWIYYNWDKTWKGIPVINRGVGGTMWKTMYSHIGATITDYKPKVIVLYFGENEYNTFILGENKNVSETVQPYFIKYYDEVRKQNPKACIILLSMVTSPMMVNKGYAENIIALNNIYVNRVAADTSAGNRAMYLDVNSLYPASNASLWRPDFLHLNNYEPMTQVVKPALIDALNAPEPNSDTIVTDTVITDTLITDTLIADTLITDTLITDTPVSDTTIIDVPQPKVRPVMFIGSSTIHQWDIDKSFPELEGNWVKAAYSGYKWSDIFYNLGDTVKKVMPRQVVIYSGDNDIVLKIPLATMQKFFQRICNEKIWAYDSTIIVTFMYTKPSNPTKAVEYEVKLADGSVVQENGWSVTQYFNRNMNKWLRTYQPHRSTPSADTYYSNLYNNGTLKNENYQGLNNVHWSATGYDINDERVRPLLTRQ